MLLRNILKFTNGILQPQQTTSIAQVRPTQSKNPFASSNPFLATAEKKDLSFGKNTPVFGGYFAGYYNGKPNIVGKRLFVEV